MVVHAGQQDRSARAATRRRRERVGEANTLRRELVEAGCCDDAIAIRANGLAAVIVRDEEHDVALRMCAQARRSSSVSGTVREFAAFGPHYKGTAAVTRHCGLTGKRRSMSGSPSRTLLRCASAQRHQLSHDVRVTCSNVPALTGIVSKVIEMRCLYRWVTVARKVAVPEVICQDDDDVERLIDLSTTRSGPGDA